MNASWLADLTDRVIAGGDAVSAEEAVALLECPAQELARLLGHTDRIRGHFFGTSITLCSILNARSGLCSEDCAFCSQSSHHQCKIDVHPMMEPESILEAARIAERLGATTFSIVTSGKGVKRGRDLEKAILALERIGAETGLTRCASLGMANADSLRALAEAGLRRFHHNLETAHSFYPRICTTRGFEENVRTIRDAKETGLEVCSGGIFGMGETPAQRVELALVLRDLEVDSVAVNFLNPIPGTRLSDRDLLDPKDALRIVSMLRFVMPGQRIAVCGGRERVLGDRQNALFSAGATGIMIGDYLTTRGRSADEDLRMVHELGLHPGEDK